MNKLVMLKGLPGSGKSTWAKEVLAKDKRKWKRVNKDDLRAMLDDGKWSRDNEKFILRVRDAVIVNALCSGFNVLVDDTNLAPKHEKALRELAKTWADDFDIQDFTHVPLEQCIKQDLNRSKSVGERVIREMYNQFLAPKPEEPVRNPELPNAIMCDLDGTLCLFGDENPYERDFLKDKLNPAVEQILAWKAAGEGDGYPETKLLLLSGRDDKFEEQTRDWLRENDIDYDYLLMRENGDSRKDTIVKREMYEKYIKGKYNIELVLDDRSSVVALWRSLGLTCLQVAPGDF